MSSSIRGSPKSNTATCVISSPYCFRGRKLARELNTSLSSRNWALRLRLRSVIVPASRCTYLLFFGSFETTGPRNLSYRAVLSCHWQECSLAQLSFVLRPYSVIAPASRCTYLLFF